MAEHLHIVSFDVPFPPDYGGVIDVYNRAKALKNAGIKITLHCFEYGRGRNHDFSEIADTVFYYSRSTFFSAWLKQLPYIVASRSVKELLNNLQNDSDPILLEGQHCSFWGNQLAVSGRKVIIRSHNIEWQYYAELAKRSSNLFKKWFFKRESKQLRIHEKSLKSIPIACISEVDQAYFLSNGFEARYLPVTLIENQNQTETPKEAPVFDHPFCLFHGNLSVPENVEAVGSICSEYMRSPFPIPVVFAGKNPSKAVAKQIKDAGCTLIANPNEELMCKLLHQTTLHLLIGFQVSGIKIKVLNGIQSAKPCIATKEMITGTGLEAFVEIWNRETSLSETIRRSIQLPREKSENVETDLYYLFGEYKVVDFITKWMNSTSIQP